MEPIDEPLAFIDLALDVRLAKTVKVEELSAATAALVSFREDFRKRRPELDLDVLGASWFIAEGEPRMSLSAHLLSSVGSESREDQYWALRLRWDETTATLAVEARSQTQIFGETTAVVSEGSVALIGRPVTSCDEEDKFEVNAATLEAALLAALQKMEELAQGYLDKCRTLAKEEQPLLTENLPQPKRSRRKRLN
jgi:hypothetical protein